MEKKGVEKDEVSQITRQSNSKLHLTFLSLLAIIVALAWICLETANWYVAKPDRVALANFVPQGNKGISGLTLMEINGPNNFFNLTRSAFANQSHQIRSGGTPTVTEAQRITVLLPVFVLIFAAIALTVVLLIFRRRARIANTLLDGARAFASGDLEHRIPELRFGEFARIAKALNTMALELSVITKRQRVDLENMVWQRTQQLDASNEKLAKADATRRQVLADLSHEIRTPLTVIKAEAEIAQRGIGKSEAEYREAIRRILKQADHAKSLVEDLMFIARVEAGEPRLKVESVSVVGLIKSLCDEFETSARDRDITIEQRTQGISAMVHGDVRRLKQVFMILMDNALRYSKPGGKVEVSARLAADHVLVSFHDYGIGLSDEEAEHAFDRYYRGRKARRHAKGSGLGLTVAKVIVEAHGGTISLQGKPDEGATASVTLPIPKLFKGVS